MGALSAPGGNEAGGYAVAKSMTTDELLEYRAAKDEFFKHDHHSPIVDQSAFSGLRYFSPDPAYRFTVPPTPSDGATIEVQTSDGQVRAYRRSATVTLETPGSIVELTLFTTEGAHGFFVPFRDTTSGSDTYGAGRYLDVEPNEDGTVTIDFNLAYNPFCAYSDAYSCPLPPAENWLRVPIAAGEKDFRPI